MCKTHDLVGCCVSLRGKVFGDVDHSLQVPFVVGHEYHVMHVCWGSNMSTS